MKVKLKVSELYDLEQVAETGIGIIDALVTLLRCNSDVAAGLAHDADVQKAYDLGRARGVANLMAVLEREGSKGNVSAINTLIKAGKVAADVDQQAAIEIRRKRSVRVVDMGREVRAMAEEQRKLIEDNWPPPIRSEVKLANGTIQPLGAWGNVRD